MAAEQNVAANPADPAAMKELSRAEGQLDGTLGRLFALSEAYPDLKANQNMLALQEELTATENKVGFARQAFNLETAVGAGNARQAAVGPEDSGRRSVTHLELLRSSRNRPESLANACFPLFGTPGNCGF